MEGITGNEAVKFMLDGKRFRQEVSAVVGRPETEALDGVRQLKESYAALQKDLKKARTEMFASGGSGAGEELTIGKFKLVCRDFGEDADKDVVGVWADEITRPNSPIVALGLFDAGGKRQLAIKASPAAVKENGFHAGNLARSVLPKLGGRGGGKPNFAQGSVADGTNWEQLEPLVRSYLAGDDF
jgi:alanyl-tRNA synthetase